MVHLPEYVLLRLDRGEKIGGGVGIYIHQSLKGRVLSCSPSPYSSKPEFIIADVTGLNSSNLLLCIMYRPPKCCLFSDFECALLKHYPTYNNLVILGDFNIDVLRNNYETSYLKNFIFSNNLHLVPFEPTHHTSSSHTLLDLCIVDDCEKVVNYSQYPVPFLSAHDLICIKYKFSTRRFLPRSYVSRNLNNFDNALYQSNLLIQDWAVISSASHVDLKVEALCSNLLHCVNMQAPKRICYRKRPPTPWITEEIKYLMKERNQLRCAYIRTRDPLVHCKFKSHRNKVKSLINSTKRQFYSNVFTKPMHSNMAWRHLRQLGLLRQKEGLIINDFSLNQFNEYFTSLTSCDPNGSTQHITSIEPLVPYNDRNFYFKHITPDLLTKTLRRCKSQSLGIDEISIDFINKAGDVLFPVVLEIFNHSLSTSVYPSMWKSAIVLPIKKLRNPSSPSDYRPISLLCSLSKVLEKLVHQQISDYLIKNNKLDPYQSGFRKNFSTQSALLKITDDIRLAIDRKMVTILVLFDFSKAFDRVNHAKLLAKLARLNFSASVLNWFHSYLTDRKQAVKDSVGNLSSWLPVKHGVPQGSVLGPLLFAIYILDLPKTLKHCNYMLYADDLQIYFQCHLHDLRDGITKVQRDAEAISSWVKDNQITLNSTKTKAIIIGSSKFINKINYDILPRIEIDNVTVHYSNVVRNLGIQMNTNLTWHDQVNQISNRVNSILYQLKTQKHVLPTHTRTKLINALAFPHLDYCSLVFGDLTNELNERLQRIQNSCIRFIFNLRYDEHVSSYREKLSWLPVKDRRNYLLSVFLFSLFSTSEPKYLMDMFEHQPESRTMITRSASSDLYCPTHRTTKYHHSFLVSSTKLWNSLPINLKNISNKQTFRTKLHFHLSRKTQLSNL